MEKSEFNIVIKKEVDIGDEDSRTIPEIQRNFCRKTTAENTANHSTAPFAVNNKRLH